MKKLMGLILAASLFAGCASAPEPEPASSITFKDDLGREITLEEAPDSVASLIGSYTDMWVDAGGKDSMKASVHDAFTSFGMDPESMADLGEIKNPNLEALAETEPDLVIASAKNAEQMALEDTFDSMEVPVAYFDVSNFEDYLRVLKIFTDLTGDEAAYKTLGTSQQDKIEELRKKAQAEYAPTVLYLRATGKGVSAQISEGTILGEMLADLHTDNIAESYPKVAEKLSVEQILNVDPEMVFLVVQGSDPAKAQKQLDKYLDNPLWKQLAAYKNKQIHVMDSNLYNLKPNEHWAEAYENLYEILHN